jgi:hypothetical protein
MQVWVRAFGDAERKDVAMASLRASVRLEDALDNPESDEYAVYILPLQRVERDTLISIVQAWAENDAVQESLRAIKDEYIPFPEPSTDEEKRDTLRKREANEKEIREQRLKFVKERTEAAGKAAEGKSIEDLRREAILRRKGMAALEVVGAESIRHTVLICTETEDGQKVFSGIEEVKGLDSSVLNSLWLKQQEVDSLDPWAIAKFRPRRKPKRMVDTRQESASEA